MKGYISNILIVIFALAVFCGIGFIIKKDINKIEDHLTECRQQCYPAQVAEEFSRKYCVCQPIIIPKSELDEE